MYEELKQSTTDKDEFVSTIVTNKQGKTFAFIREENLKLDPGKRDLISGHIKANGELPIHAMYRELKEEAGIAPEDILKFYNLDVIKLPHPKISGKTCHLYCIEIDFSKEQLVKSINERATEKEIKDVLEFENIEALLEDIKDLTSNWRIFCSEELEKKLNLASNIVKEQNKLNSYEKM